MNHFVFKPDPSVKTVWFIILAILGFMVVLPMVVMLAVGEALGWFFLLLFIFFILLPLIIYLPLYYKSLEYSIDEDAARMRGGVIWKRDVTVTYGKITNIDITQGPLERAFGLSKIHLQTAGAGGQQGQKAELVIIGIRDALQLKDRIMGYLKAFKTGGGAVAAPIANPQTDAGALQSILEEIVRIRKAVEKE